MPGEAPTGAKSVHLAELANSAMLLMRDRRLDDASRVWSQILSLSPDHAQALFYLGQHALFRKDTSDARQLFQRAARADPDNPAIPLNMSFVFRAENDARSELAALTRALTIDPYFFPALLARGRLEERQGETRKAARTYKDLLTIAPPDDQLTADMQQAMAHARDIIKQNADALDAFLRVRLSGIKARNAGADLDRFAECEGIATGRRQIFSSKASLLTFPWLPAIPFYSRAEFPWLTELEAATSTIREELLGALQNEGEEFKPYINHPDGAPLNQWADLNRSMDWNTFFLWKDGERVEKHCRRCPKTAALMETLPMIDIPTLGPTVLFSALEPRAHIPAHTGSTNVRLIVHLPLIVPPGCRFRVGNVTREWREGEAWVFDDTIDHEAWNGSDRKRVILMIDVWNPYLQAAERELVSGLLSGMQEYYS
ncbi:MAG TPA: aspartyl/asparaginyl beta-hydroxylase domain-containing protein [Rhizomicrobium sp.]|nr:aspartyl/asparaginyl beta-hydroxylase domain-containing protein [Rhizomicrobium sp.]